MSQDLYDAHTQDFFYGNTKACMPPEQREPHQWTSTHIKHFEILNFVCFTCSVISNYFNKMFDTKITVL